MNVSFKKPNHACFVINYNFMSIRNADLQISAHVCMWAHLSTGRCSVINKARFIYIILKCPWREALVGNIQIMVEREWQRSRRQLLCTRPLCQAALIGISMLCSTWLSKTGGSNWEFNVARSNLWACFYGYEMASNLALFGKVCYQSKFRPSKRAEIFCLPLKLTNRIDEAFLLISSNVSQE